MGEIRFVGTGETRGYPYLMCKKEKSEMRVTDRHHEACRLKPRVILNDGFFYPHYMITPMIDTFSCIPFDLPHLIFKVELAIK